MNVTQNNCLSRIEREYISFLYDNATRSTNQTVTIDQIQEFISTPEAQRGLESFKVMRKPVRNESTTQRIGAFL